MKKTTYLKYLSIYIYYVYIYIYIIYIFIHYDHPLLVKHTTVSGSMAVLSTETFPKTALKFQKKFIHLFIVSLIFYLFTLKIIYLLSHLKTKMNYKKVVGARLDLVALRPNRT